jgi:hypothetical protein
LRENRRELDGPLAPFAAGIEDMLLTEGYLEEPARVLMRLVSELSRWLERRRLGASDLSEEVIDRAPGPTSASDLRWAGYLFRWGRGQDELVNNAGRSRGSIKEPLGAVTVEVDKDLALARRFYPLGNDN